MRFDKIFSRAFALAAALLLLGGANRLSAQYYIFDGLLGEGMELNLDSHHGDRSWLEDLGGNMKMTYPGNQGWGAVFFTYGPPMPDEQKDARETRDFSKYAKMLVDLRGEVGGEVVQVGMKDKDDPSNGRETKKSLTLTKDWKTYTILLSEFRTADLKLMHLPCEFVFGRTAATVYFKNIRFE